MRSHPAKNKNPSSAKLGGCVVEVVFSGFPENSGVKYFRNSLLLATNLPNWVKEW
jgi:hypothetical protein